MIAVLERRWLEVDGDPVKDNYEAFNKWNDGVATIAGFSGYGEG
jgi:hypothetical protein